MHKSEQFLKIIVKFTFLLPFIFKKKTIMPYDVKKMELKFEFHLKNSVYLLTTIL